MDAYPEKFLSQYHIEGAVNLDTSECYTDADA